MKQLPNSLYRWSPDMQNTALLDSKHGPRIVWGIQHFDRTLQGISQPVVKPNIDSEMSTHWIVNKHVFSRYIKSTRYVLKRRHLYVIDSNFHKIAFLRVHCMQHSNDKDREKVIHQTSDSQIISHILPWWASDAVSVVRLREPSHVIKRLNSNAHIIVKFTAC